VRGSLGIMIMVYSGGEVSETNKNDKRDTHMIVVFRDSIDAELQVPHERRDDRPQLHICELLANTPVLASTERLIRGLGTLAHSTEAEVDLLAVLIEVRLESLRRNTLRVAPSDGVPLVSLLPDLRVHLRDDGRGHDEVALGNNIGLVFARAGEGSRDGDIVADVAHDAVDGRVNTESLADDGIKDRELAKFFVGHGAELAIGSAEVLDLFLVESLAKGQRQFLQVP